MALNSETATTPSRKRKREREIQSEGTPPFEKAEIGACFTNAAFSSTPKKVAGRRRKNLIGKENLQLFQQNVCMEVKSIADLAFEGLNGKQVHESATIKTEINKNPYEVERKPPKKKKREVEIAEACFENPALNLDTPEKQFNPYEVVRTPVLASDSQTKTKCFINEALNLRTKETGTPQNPFEIQRKDFEAITKEPDCKEKSAPTNLQIGLPFMPTIGCRIDFTNISLSQLTPSKLLADKLVFSPVPLVGPKRSLGSISEESSMDIGKELDCYQLELENSINEAKLRKNCEHPTINPSEITLNMAMEQKITFTQKLAEISECDESPFEEQNVQVVAITLKSKLEEKLDVLPSEQKTQAIKPDAEMVKDIEVDCYKNHDESIDEKVTADDDICYASESDEEEVNFKAPAPFVRAYRRAESPKHASSKESLNSLKSNNSDKSEDRKKSLNVKNIIRKSFRKLMHPMQTNNDNNVSAEKEPEKHTNIITSIRQSLRRKPTRQLLIEEPTSEGEISIIDTSERTMKLKSTLPRNEYAKIEDLTNERKHSLRNSIKRSTRGVKQQFLKTVFHKNQEEYAFTK